MPCTPACPRWLSPGHGDRRWGSSVPAGSPARWCRHGARSPHLLHVLLPLRHIFGFYMEGGLPALHPPVFLQRLVVNGWTPWRCPRCPCYPPWRSECLVPPAPSASAALGAAPCLWVRWGGGRGGRGGLAASVALPCSVLLPFPRLQGLVAESQRIPFPCPCWVRRGIFSAWGRNSSVGWGQHLGAPGHAEIPVAKGGIEQRGRTQLPPPWLGQGGCSIPAPSSTKDALPRRGASLRRHMGKPG